MIVSAFLLLACSNNSGKKVKPVKPNGDYKIGTVVEENTNNITFNNTIAMENRKGIIDNKKAIGENKKAIEDLKGKVGTTITNINTTIDNKITENNTKIINQVNNDVDAKINVVKADITKITNNVNNVSAKVDANTTNITNNTTNINKNTTAITELNTKVDKNHTDLMKRFDYHNEALSNHEGRIQALEQDNKTIKTHITTECLLDPIPVFTRPSPGSTLGKVIMQEIVVPAHSQVLRFHHILILPLFQ